jgi:hypothetical protein
MTAPIPLAGIPPALNATPTSVNQLIWTPARVPNIFTSSFQSGDKSQGQVIGTGIIGLPLIVDYTMGNFSVTLQFPPNSFLYAVSITGLVAFTAVSAPTVQLGRTAGGAEILAATALSKVLRSVTNAPVIGSLPFPGDASVLPAWQASLTVAANGAGANTAGSNLVVILYGRQ